MTASIKRIAVIGTGVIGSGWIIRFLANKKTVYVFDPNKEQKKFVLNEITRTQRSVKKFYKINSINRKNLIFAKEIDILLIAGIIFIEATVYKEIKGIITSIGFPIIK